MCTPCPHSSCARPELSPHSCAHSASHRTHLPHISVYRGIRLQSKSDHTRSCTRCPGFPSCSYVQSLDPSPMQASHILLHRPDHPCSSRSLLRLSHRYVDRVQTSRLPPADRNPSSGLSATLAMGYLLHVSLEASASSPAVSQQPHPGGWMFRHSHFQYHHHR